MTLRLDYSNMMISPGGIDAAALTSAASEFAAAHRKFEERRRSGSVGFVDLPADKALLDQVLRYAENARGKYDDVVILGIGGSALGPIALRTALRPSGWNMLDENARGNHPRLHVLDNVDPETIAALLDRLRLRRTLFVVTSKSGGTAETMAQFLIVHARLVREELEPARHLVFVTDPKAGALRPLAQRLTRFGLEALLAVWYGPRILRWLDSQLFQDIVAGCIALAAVLTTVSIVRLVRSTKPAPRRAAA